MKALMITDHACTDEAYLDLKNLVADYFRQKGYETTVKEVDKSSVTYCMGCFGCWIKKPGECVIKDEMADINREFVNSTAAVYLSPVMFGQFSANIKNAVDRSIPNILPFFFTRDDGSTMHPSRYSRYPRIVMIGYAADLAEGDRQLFADITKKHRRNIEVLFYEGSMDDDKLISALDGVAFRQMEEMA